MLTVPCPGCSKPLGLTEEVCPHCRRPRDEHEVAKGHADARQDALRLKDRPRRILVRMAAATAVAGALTIAWNSRDAASVRLQAAWADFNVEVRRVQDPLSHTKPQTSADPSLLSAVAASLSNPEKPAKPAPPSDAPATAPGTTPAVVARPSGPNPLLENAWRVTGTVYGLSTLAPVPKALVVFKYEGRPSVEATTNEQGAYEVDLDKRDGWSVSLKAPNHRRGQILDIDPPYRVRDADERHAAFEHLTDGDLIPAQVGWKRASSRVRLDLVAAPQYWSDAPSPP